MNVCVKFEDSLSDITGVQGFSLSSSHLPTSQTMPYNPILICKICLFAKEEKNCGYKFGFKQQGYRVTYLIMRLSCQRGTAHRRTPQKRF